MLTVSFGKKALQVLLFALPQFGTSVAIGGFFVFLVLGPVRRAMKRGPTDGVVVLFFVPSLVVTSVVKSSHKSKVLRRKSKLTLTTEYETLLLGNSKHFNNYDHDYYYLPHYFTSYFFIFITFVW
jgi:hypothetical protein